MSEPNSVPVNSGLNGAFRALTGAFRAQGIATPALDARLLVMAACGVSHAELIGNPDRPLRGEQRARLEGMAARRRAGEPVSRILGSRAFWGFDLRVAPETLDPRPDTETLVEAVLAALRGRETAALRILDLGTGAGCILIALLSELPHAAGVGTDISQAALKTARANAERAGIGDRARFVGADWLNGVVGAFDVIVSNPPYIRRSELAALSPEVSEHDPAAALDGGADGLDAYRAILRDLDLVLKPGGVAGFEVGCAQAAAVGAMMTEAGLVPVLPHGMLHMRDLAGIERVLVASRPDEHHMAKKELESRAIHDSLD